ncbi:MAG: hypothetical protein ABJA98_30825 [Acidobacteriota bacterium]
MVSDKRGSNRQAISVPARLLWKDQRGVDRFAEVVTHDVSDSGVFVESETALSLALYRLVQFQLDPTVRITSAFPDSLRHGQILSAVYRISPAHGYTRHGIALRLMSAQ